MITMYLSIISHAICFFSEKYCVLFCMMFFRKKLPREGGYAAIYERTGYFAAVTKSTSFRLSLQTKMTEVLRYKNFFEKPLDSDAAT